MKKTSKPSKAAKAAQKKQEQARQADEKKQEITKDLVDRIAVTQVIEKVVYLLAYNKFLVAGSTDSVRSSQFECALRLLNREHFEDIL